MTRWALFAILVSTVAAASAVGGPGRSPVGVQTLAEGQEPRAVDGVAHMDAHADGEAQARDPSPSAASPGLLPQPTSVEVSRQIRLEALPRTTFLTK